MATDQGLCCLVTEISMKNTVKMKYQPITPKTRNGLIQMIRMGYSIGQNRVNYHQILTLIYSPKLLCLPEYIPVQERAGYIEYTDKMP